MIRSLTEAMSGMMEILSQGGTYPILDRTVIFDIPIRSARKSAQDYTEEKTELYPQGVIYDYMPEFGPDWSSNYQKRVDKYSGFTTTSPANSTPSTAAIFSEPTQMSFKFDLTFYVKDPMHRYAVMDYMARNYGSSGRWVLNKTVMPEGDLGDFVSYKVLPSENTRTDGIYELNYEFTAKTFVALDPEIDAELISIFNIVPNPINP